MFSDLGCNFNLAMILFICIECKLVCSPNKSRTHQLFRSFWMHYKKHPVNYAYGVTNRNGNVFHLKVVRFEMKNESFSSESARDVCHIKP